MRAGVVVGLAAVLLLVPGVARADNHVEGFGPTEKRALWAATYYWGMGKPEGCSVIRAYVAGDDELPGIEGRATVPPAGKTIECALHLWGGHNSFYGACQTLIHEVGHLHGFRHSGDPLSPMWEGEYSHAHTASRHCRAYDRLLYLTRVCKRRPASAQQLLCWRAAHTLQHRLILRRFTRAHTAS